MPTSGGTAADLHPVVLHHVVNTLGWPSLRPLQAAAVEPVVSGRDALLLAPTAGGKTEAAFFPLLTRMESEGWRGLSVLYVTPLRALLNNLQPRLDSYAAWLGRRVGLWHGDVGDPRRRRLLADPPDVLLTTPESLEAMLVSTRVDNGEVFGRLRAVVVDEIHAFAGDDRGWHLLAVLARLQAIAGRPVQRVGLSATVGNPAELLDWLQAGGRSERGVVVAPDDDAGRVGAAATSSAEIALDHVGSVDNAATVIAALHRGEKRLVFADSRRRVEELALALRARGVTTFLSHSSLAADERRRSEQAFAEARDCVIVATSTLELGIDVGDLDRVIQVDAPATVASFLQRLGRTGRRAGTPRSMLFLSLDQNALLQASALLSLWGRGWVEPVTPPPAPHHIAAQQILALALQGGWVGRSVLDTTWTGLPLHEYVPEISAHLLAEGFLHDEDGLLSIGTAAEAEFGRRHFMELTSVFTADPVFTVLHGRTEIGLLHPITLTARLAADQPRVVLLAGRSWRVTHVDWGRRRAYVEATDDRGLVRFSSRPRPLSFAVTRAIRDVLLGTDPPVALTRRATAALTEVRADHADVVDDDRLVIRRDGGDLHWWTWAGGAGNLTLAATLGVGVADPVQRVDDRRLRLLPDLTFGEVQAAVAAARRGDVLDPDVEPQAVTGLKFAEALPHHLAVATLAARLRDEASAREVLGAPVAWS